MFEIVVWIFDVFETHLEIRNNPTKYLKEIYFFCH